ncbi:phosphatidate cytidylyltransferase [Luteibacter aegosomatissinici]|jgi:phosphatidate cytidylyltransferase|uniref:phosphatidate cytidylyltransferase n=1 Tax=Luteibacter aegosomatissinici TaxID=2911539 RepID=UPI001FF8E921|nr:CDP-archaeol synthase [Luteibacter aegosomatissinici]UPG93541.1 CDP-archaeol synthase [Luteibacter aegosomatissinici]
MLKQRIITAAILLPIVLALILLPPTGFFAAVAAIAFVGAAWEWAQLAGFRTQIGRGVVAAAAAVIIIVMLLVRTHGLLAALTFAGVAWWIGCCFWLRHFTFAAAPNSENRMLKLGAGLLVIVPALAAAADIHASERGHGWTLLALAIVWAADTGAYFSGRYFGRRKLAPRISPGKTWAGVYGAVAAGGLVALVGGWILGVDDTGKLVGLVILGFVTVAFAVVGDLFESLMKRHAAVKDSGSLIPGHGGLLDRMDSVFAALPIFAAGKLLLGL